MEIDLRKLGLVLAAVAAGLLLWDYPVVYPLKLLVVFMHESGHAFASKLVGGSVESIRVNHMQGGLCISRIPPGFFNDLILSSGGYLGSAISGAVLLVLTLRWKRSGRGVLVLLTGWLLAICVLWARDPMTLLIGFSLAGVLGAGAKFLPDGATQLAALFIAVFSGLYALFDLRDDLWDAGRRAGTDAAKLSEFTPIPSIVWAVLWTVFAVAVLGLALWVGLRGRKRTSSQSLRVAM